MKNLFFLLSAIFWLSCSSPSGDVSSSSTPHITTQPSNQHTLNAVLYHQTAGEYKALCYQVYQLSKLQLKNKLQQHAFPYEKSPAIIMDLDETVIDNSYYNAQLILDSTQYQKSTWKDWSDMAQATAVPGAIEFIQFAQANGVNVFFISNRYTNELQATMKNLQQLGLTNVDSNQFLLRVKEGSKDARRAAVNQNYEVLMLFGDNLADFATVFDKKPISERNALVDSLHAQFGNNFIVIPNILYGEWEGALTNYNHSLSQDENNKLRMEHLKGYK